MNQAQVRELLELISNYGEARCDEVRKLDYSGHEVDRIWKAIRTLLLEHLT